MRWLPCLSERDEDEEQRLVAHRPDVANRYVDNTVTNSKYTPATFLPKNLFEQFQRPLNRYFLLITALQFISVIAPVNPLSTLLPLVFAFLLTAAKEGYDDLQRHKRDRAANSRTYEVFKQGHFEATPSQDIRVGDVVRIGNNEELPCDLLLLLSSMQDGVCYLQTANVDGEIDLKARSCLPEVVHLFEVGGPEALYKFPGELICDPPNDRIYEFNSRLRLEGKDISVSTQQLLLQSCMLRNTEWVLGMVVYTGNETKCGMNKHQPPNKWAQVDQRTTYFSKAIFIFQITIALILGIVGNVLRATSGKKHWYLAENSTNALTWVIIPLRFFLLTSVMIPISFKVVVDLSKYYISLAMAWDIKMYDWENDAPCVANSTAIAEDLGQVQVLLTDKTGTLTENFMQFKCCTVGNRVWGGGAEFEATGNCDLSDAAGALADPAFHKAAKEDPKVRQFVRQMALCHTVIPKFIDDQIEFQGSSPDEEALVAAAAELGAVLVRRTKREIDLILHGTREECSVMEVLEFTSDRKRMSVVLREKRSGQLSLLCKGADDKLLARMETSQELTALTNHLDTFASNGLRTLVYGWRPLQQDEYEEWHQRYQRAKATTGQGRDQEVQVVCEDLERNLIFSGATAIEDRLQERVPEAIEKLRRAGIRIWMLTGDKFETAKQIAITCNLLQPDEHLFAIDQNEAGTVMEEVRSALQYVHHQEQYAEVEFLLNEQGVSIGQYCLIITGGALEFALTEENRKEFSDLALACRAVICCRVTPGQKAAVTALAKDTGRVTLAVGDGGNDVSMIQEAHVGVGIRGKEGMQASRAADYSIAKFKFLLPLILVHGHYSYQRTCYIVQYSFYKSMLLSMVNVAFNFWTMLSGMAYWTSFYQTMWNGFFTLPTILCYVLNRDLPRQRLLQCPELFYYSRTRRFLNYHTFVGFIARGIIQAVVCLFLTFGIFGPNAVNPQTKSPLDMTGVCTVSYTALILLQSFILISESHTLTWINDYVIWGMLPLYFLSVLIMSAFPRFESYGAFIACVTHPVAWLAVVVIATAMFIPQIALQAWRYNFTPTRMEQHHYVSVMSGEEEAHFDQWDPWADELAPTEEPSS